MSLSVSPFTAHVTGTFHSESLESSTNCWGRRCGHLGGSVRNSGVKEVRRGSLTDSDRPHDHVRVRTSHTLGGSINPNSWVTLVTL